MRPSHYLFGLMAGFMAMKGTVSGESPELEKSLEKSKGSQRADMGFLIANMPMRDLQELDAATLCAFPMVWNPYADYASAEDVTDRYKKLFGKPAP